MLKNIACMIQSFSSKSFWVSQLLSLVCFLILCFSKPIKKTFPEFNTFSQFFSFGLYLRKARNNLILQSLKQIFLVILQSFDCLTHFKLFLALWHKNYFRCQTLWSFLMESNQFSYSLLELLPTWCVGSIMSLIHFFQPFLKYKYLQEEK